MPQKTWATNDVPTASDFNTQFRDQVVTTCTSGTRPAGTEGQLIYETDTDLLYIYNGGWVRFGSSAGWTSYTPTLTQSGAVTKTVTYAKYEKVGRMVTCDVRLDVTGTGTGNNAISITLPFTASANGLWVGQGVVYDASVTTIYPGLVALTSTTVAALTDAAAITTVNLFLGQTGTSMTAALASGDALAMGFTYEATT
jgi:hypothetical protein